MLYVLQGKFGVSVYRSARCNVEFEDGEAEEIELGKLEMFQRNSTLLVTEEVKII